MWDITNTEVFLVDKSNRTMDRFLRAIFNRARSMMTTAMSVNYGCLDDHRVPITSHVHKIGSRNRHNVYEYRRHCLLSDGIAARRTDHLGNYPGDEFDGRIHR